MNEAHHRQQRDPDPYAFTTGGHNDFLDNAAAARWRRYHAAKTYLPMEKDLPAEHVESMPNREYVCRWLMSMPSKRKLGRVGNGKGVGKVVSWEVNGLRWWKASLGA